MDSTRPIRALMRGLDALTVLNLRDGATVSEVAHEIRLPRTTVYRILETLCDSGFVYRDSADERYRLTILVRGLSEGFDDETWVNQIARPMIHGLCAEIVWPVSIATLSGTKMMLREATDHATPLAVERYSAGFQLPLLSSAAGRSFLANCPPAQRDSLIEILARSNKEEDRPARDRAELLRALAEIKSQGFATATRTRRLIDEYTISVPVPLNDRTLAALTVRFIASAVPLKTGVERFLPKLRQCAAKISSIFLEQQAEARILTGPRATV
ncbi:MAG TPA: IclR family transcriptional regulator C-terminal domain-containing protein [Steroidobacteraceae bacterium]|jgi:IclR family transcriptional regulator, mhp operon transcriptional activator|nr:IclR family transcriptional regulator C-terminal domain-containing protein [Steroidobacteraceae bacterium]